MDARMVLEELGVTLVWGDSLGAKSFAVFVETGCGGILVDPGAAAMHPSYPLTRDEKKRLRREALRTVARFVERATMVVVTHYHYDHYVRPWDADYPGPNPYRDRLVIAKDPSLFINESQRARAEELYSKLLESTEARLEDILEEPTGDVDVPDFEELMPLAVRATSKGRLEAGRRWLSSLAAKWREWRRFPERIEAGHYRIVFADSGSWEHCGVRVELLGPHFHGDIYERTGWVVPVLIEVRGHRVLYTSDLMGPLAEDYAEEVLRLKPHVLIADGPATYLPPYMFSRRDLERAKANMLRIVREAAPQLIIWDHHLPREPRWRERVSKVLSEAQRQDVPILTVAEVYGRRPLVEEVSR
ncbi:MBL fold metallo-hydrolase [Pyrolobus fumarii]|nr:MBL fold metallo-hydrolase [Pyrolobus fumarii]